MTITRIAQHTQTDDSLLAPLFLSSFFLVEFFSFCYIDTTVKSVIMDSISPMSFLLWAKLVQVL
jgi:hypothetical protein